MNKKLILFLIIFAIFLVSCAQKKSHNSSHDVSKPRYKQTMKSYKVFGKKYYPVSVNMGDKMVGISSWYGSKFNGKKTSSGEIYDMYSETAAHKTWPMGTIVKVYNHANNKSTTVRINDRGPFVGGRIIDCSYKAGKDIGLDRLGISKVTIEVVGFTKNSTVYRRDKIVKNNTNKFSNFSLQLASFSSRERAKNFIRSNSGYGQYKATVLNSNRSSLFKVVVVGFSSRQEAINFKNNNGYNEAFIINN